MSDIGPATSPTPGPTSSGMRLTLPQLDFWEEFTFHPDQPVSTVAHYIELDGQVDEALLKQAIAQTIREAEILSVRFRADGVNEPTQVCDPEFMPGLTVEDLRTEADPMAVALARMEEDLAARLDLRKDRLSAHVLYRVTDTRYLWYIRAHHIIVDGYGLALIEQRCAELYNHSLGQGLPGLPFHSLSSFLAEEDRYQASHQWEADRAYWSDYFNQTKDIEVLERGDEDYGGPGLHAQVSFPQGVSEDLRTIARDLDLGWPDLLTLLCSLYLLGQGPGNRRQAGDKVTLWLPFMSRWGSVGAHLPALLVNILPFQVETRKSEALSAFLKRSAGEMRQQRRHSRFRIEQISKDQGLMDGSRYFFSPLINVLPFNSPVFTGCKSGRHILGSGPADGFNLTFRGEADAGGLTLQLDADPSLTGKAEFDRHARDLPAFLARLLVPEMLDHPVGSLVPVPRATVQDAADLAAKCFPM
ncbi:enterobactin synthetase component F [Roseibium suaedae]|uniref:Enterobactin synthetase component F n=1 Tax=Roseibium suaedae TaxID=735517 RepID=A0A1M7MVI5_9HYPH|nr:enterobactin synthetase component F [Roseibium suaedae]